jgi:hypothetical protein
MKEWLDGWNRFPKVLGMSREWPRRGEGQYYPSRGRPPQHPQQTVRGLQGSPAALRTTRTLEVPHASVFGEGPAAERLRQGPNTMAAESHEHVAR